MTLLSRHCLIIPQQAVILIIGIIKWFCFVCLTTECVDHQNKSVCQLLARLLCEVTFGMQTKRKKPQTLRTVLTLMSIIKCRQEPDMSGVVPKTKW